MKRGQKKNMKKAKDKYAVEIGRRIEKERTRKGLTQSELGMILGQEIESAQPRISKLERGVLTPNLQELIKMSEIFDVTTDYLLCISDRRIDKKNFTVGDLFRNLFELEEKLGFSPHLETREELVPHPYTGEPYKEQIENIVFQFRDYKTDRYIKDWIAMKEVYERNKEEFENTYKTWKNDALKKNEILWENIDDYFDEELPFN